jgi:uncharacterized protein YhfF
MSDDQQRGLGDIDQVSVEQYWRRLIRQNELAAGAIVSDVFQFGDTAEMADRLLSLVVDGPKRATASCRFDYADDGSDLPSVGDLAVVCDGRGRPRGVIRTTEVRLGPLSSVDDAFAWDEGEGDRTRDDWLRMHSRYFERTLGVAWLDHGGDLPVVFERFEVVCREPGTAR